MRKIKDLFLKMVIIRDYLRKFNDYLLAVINLAACILLMIVFTIIVLNALNPYFNNMGLFKKWGSAIASISSLNILVWMTFKSHRIKLLKEEV